MERVRQDVELVVSLDIAAGVVAQRFEECVIVFVGSCCGGG